MSDEFNLNNKDLSNLKSIGSQQNYAHTSERTSISITDKATRRIVAPFVTVVKKGQKDDIPKIDNKYFTFFLNKRPNILLTDLSKFLNDTLDLTNLFHETTDVLKEVTKATGAILYFVDSAADEIVQTCRIQEGPRHRAAWKISKVQTVAAFVAAMKEYVLVDDVWEDLRFPDGVGWKGSNVKSVLCVPVVTPDNECLAVIELYKSSSHPAFNQLDLKIAVVLVSWMGAAIDLNTVRLALQKQQELNDYLINLTKCYFSDTRIYRTFFKEVFKFAKTSVGAERGIFYIINNSNNEKIADIYEEGIIEQIDAQITMHLKKQKLNITKSNTPAAKCARSGQIINITDAYSSDKVSIDSSIGHNISERVIDRNILCVPITGVKEILGVYQVINKLNGPHFTKSDERILETFAVYFSLYLHFVESNKTLLQAEKQNEVYLNLIEFYSKPSQIELKPFKETLLIDPMPNDFDLFDWYITSDYEYFMPQLILQMILECVGHANVVIEKLIEIIIMAKKSYRSNPYHNFEHALNVCHCMYNILNRNADFFTLIEREALIIACLLHDIDHSGFTNNFYRLIDHPIANLYEFSILENHQFELAMILLGDCTFFKNMTPNEYKKFRNELKNAILATDITVYFHSRAKLNPLITQLTVDWQNDSHRKVLKDILMTSADISATLKPYPIAKKLAENLCKEFYQQGDIERQMGFMPLSVMDKNLAVDTFADSQVHFLMVIALPCYELVAAVFPNTVDMLHKCRELLDMWKDTIDNKDKEVWNPEESYFKSDDDIKGLK